MSVAERVSKASRMKQANEWANKLVNRWTSGPVLPSKFLIILDHSASCLQPSSQPYMSSLMPSCHFSGVCMDEVTKTQLFFALSPSSWCEPPGFVNIFIFAEDPLNDILYLMEALYYSIILGIACSSTAYSSILPHTFISPTVANIDLYQHHPS